MANIKRINGIQIKGSGYGGIGTRGPAGGSIYEVSGEEGEALGINQWAYLKVSDGLWYLAKADAEATCSSTIGVKTATGIFQIDGPLTLTGLTAGQYFLSPTTAGAMTSITPDTNGQFIRKVGDAGDATEFIVDVDESWYELGSSIETDSVRSLTTKTADYTITISDYTIFAKATSNTVTINLTATPTQGQIIRIKCIDATFTCTIGRNSKLIEGAASDLVLALYQSETLQYDTTYGWGVI
ncbi:MAG: hypothetical protein KAS32_25175 [Candidatus Peribacteraceae bacterium]|nr:hypothetical protein [Candidatus Peribacteraceae bacterium]